MTQQETTREELAADADAQVVLVAHAVAGPPCALPWHDLCCAPVAPSRLPAADRLGGTTGPQGPRILSVGGMSPEQRSNSDELL